ISGIDRVAYGIHELVTLSSTILLLGAAFLAALALSPVAAAAACVGGCLVVFAYTSVRKRSRILGHELSRAYDGLNSRWTQTLGALRLVKSFSAEQRTTEE